MARRRVVLNRRGMRELLTDKGVADHLEGVMQPVLLEAKQIAPVESGGYRDSLRMWVDRGPNRASVHVGSTVTYGMGVEAKWGVLARSMDRMNIRYKISNLASKKARNRAKARERARDRRYENQVRREEG